MTDEHIADARGFSETFQNPVYPYSFPDPFVLKFRGEYFAYCTDFWRDGRVFGVLRSRDLVNWHEIGGAMKPLESSPPFYWAPEVTYHNGKFYLYYSAGNETLMEIRVAVSDSPDGDFVDSGRRLTTEEFAIDAHVFADTDGARYLFYATDFLEYTNIGTGTVCDRMIDFFTLENRPRPVTRAKYDWQVYDPQRKEKGGVRWHTVEGSFVLKRKDVYYQMFSGGNWQNVSYGVSFAVTDDIDANEEWTQFSDGEKIFPILRTIPNLVVGPGHNSVTRGINNRELFCVYHRWTENGRTLAIDRMDFAGGNRMFIDGATHTPQFAPYKPRAADFFDAFSDENWTIAAGDWRVEKNQLFSGVNGENEIICNASAESFLSEIWLRSETGENFGVALKNGAENVLKFTLSPKENCAGVVFQMKKDAQIKQTFALAEYFDFRAFHLLRVETDGTFVKIALDETIISFQSFLRTAAPQIALVAENSAAAFAGFALTEGYEELFEDEEIEKRGWRKISGGEWQIENKNLLVKSAGASETILAKKSPAGDFELAVNFCLRETFAEDFRFGFCLAFDETAQNAFFFVEKSAAEWILKVENAGATEKFVFPKDFSPEIFRQMRFIKTKDEIILRLETEIIGRVAFAPANSGQIALSAQNATIAFDMVRVTAL